MSAVPLLSATDNTFVCDVPSPAPQQLPILFAAWLCMWHHTITTVLQKETSTHPSACFIQSKHS